MYYLFRFAYRLYKALDLKHPITTGQLRLDNLKQKFLSENTNSLLSIVSNNILLEILDREITFHNVVFNCIIVC